MAPWEISQLDRHMLSYCVSLENTPTQVCGVATAALLSCCPVALPRRRMLLCWSSRLPRAAAAARSMVRDAAGCLPASPPVRPHGAPDAHTRPYSGAGARVHRAGEADGGGQAEKVCSLALQPKCSVLLILIKGGEGQGAEGLRKLGAPRFGQAGREGSLANQNACACARARTHTHTHTQYRFQSTNEVILSSLTSSWGSARPRFWCWCCYLGSGALMLLFGALQWRRGRVHGG